MRSAGASAAESETRSPPKTFPFSFALPWRARLWRLLQRRSGEGELRQVYLGRGAVAEVRLRHRARRHRVGRRRDIEEQAQQEIGRPVAKLASVWRYLQVAVRQRRIEFQRIGDGRCGQNRKNGLLIDTVPNQVTGDRRR